MLIVAPLWVGWSWPLKLLALMAKLFAPGSPVSSRRNIEPDETFLIDNCRRTTRNPYLSIRDETEIDLIRSSKTA